MMNTLQVKIFSDISASNLEKKINKWLSERNAHHIEDIQYEVANKTNNMTALLMHSALITYMPNEGVECSES